MNERFPVSTLPPEEGDYIAVRLGGAERDASLPPRRTIIFDKAAVNPDSVRFQYTTDKGMGVYETNPSALPLVEAATSASPRQEARQPQSERPTREDLLRWQERALSRIEYARELYGGAKEVRDSLLQRPDVAPIVHTVPEELPDGSLQEHTITEAVVDLPDAEVLSIEDVPSGIDSSDKEERLIIDLSPSEAGGDSHRVEIQTSEQAETAQLDVLVDDEPVDTPAELASVESLVVHITEEIKAAETTESEPVVEADEAVATEEPAAVKEEPPTQAAVEAQLSPEEREAGFMAQYLRELGRTNPEVVCTVQRLVNETALAEGRTPDELFAKLNTKFLQFDDASRQAMILLHKERVTGRSILWSETPNQQTQIGRAAREVQDALETIVRSALR